MYELIVSVFFKSIDLLYKWISENFIAHVLTFSKEFGAVVIFISAVIFLLITIYFVLKQAKRLPKRYFLETFDQNGIRTEIPELRVTFATYQAAATMPNSIQSFIKKYKFKLLGLKENFSTLGRLH